METHSTKQIISKKEAIKNNFKSKSMKTSVIKMVVLMMTATFVTSVARAGNEMNLKQESQQKKKEKEPKKEFDWADFRPSKLSGDEDMDRYILMCDTVWERIQSYKDSIHFYSVSTRTVGYLDEKHKVVCVCDEDGNEKNVTGSILQGAKVAVSGTSIILDATNITLATTNAGLVLTKKPLLAFGYTKCLKGGPQIVSLAYHEMKDIVTALRTQTKELKQLHDSRLEGSTSTYMILPVEEGVVPSEDEILTLDKRNELFASNTSSAQDEQLEAEWAAYNLDELDKELDSPK
jgi:hypothetical protein